MTGTPSTTPCWNRRSWSPTATTSRPSRRSLSPRRATHRTTRHAATRTCPRSRWSPRARRPRATATRSPTAGVPGRTGPRRSHSTLTKTQMGRRLCRRRLPLPRDPAPARELAAVSSMVAGEQPANRRPRAEGRALAVHNPCKRCGGTQTIAATPGHPGQRYPQSRMLPAHLAVPEVDDARRTSPCTLHRSPAPLSTSLRRTARLMAPQMAQRSGAPAARRPTR